MKLTVKEAIQYTRISRATLYRMMKAHSIAYLKIGSRIFFDTTDLDKAFIRFPTNDEIREKLA